MAICPHVRIRTGKSSLADIEALAGRLWRASISTSGRAIKHAIPDVLENYLESLAAQCVEERRRIKRVGAQAAIGQTRRERGEEKGRARGKEMKEEREQAGRGSNFAYLNGQALDLAEEVARISPAAERLRFCASGTEATMYCQRLARAFTGRPKILKFEGAYHGNHDYALVSTFPNAPGNYPQGAADTAGQPVGTRDSVMVAPYNDLDTATALAEAAAEFFFA